MMTGVAQAVALTASHSSAERVLDGSQRADGTRAEPGRTLLFGGSSTTLGREAVDEELFVRGSRWGYALLLSRQGRPR